MNRLEFEVCGHCQRRLPEEFREVDWDDSSCPHCGKDVNIDEFKEK